MDLTQLLVAATHGEGKVLHGDSGAASQEVAVAEEFRAELSLLLGLSGENRDAEEEADSPERRVPVEFATGDRAVTPPDASARADDLRQEGEASARPPIEALFRFLKSRPSETPSDPKGGAQFEGDAPSPSEEAGRERSSGPALASGRLPSVGARENDGQATDSENGLRRERELGRMDGGRGRGEKASDESSTGARPAQDVWKEAGSIKEGSAAGPDGRQPFRSELRDPIAAPLREGPARAAAEARPQPAGASEQGVTPHETTAAEKAEKTGGSQAPVLPRSSEVMDQIVDRIRLLRTGELRTLEVRLKPDFLGRVRIETELGEGNLLKARIAVENPRVRALVESQLPSLQEHFARAGLRVESVEVRTLPPVAGFSADPSLAHSRRDEAETRGRTSTGRPDGVEGTRPEDEAVQRLRLGRGGNYWIA